MKLLGVIHDLRYLSSTLGCIDGLFHQNPPKSMMLELPANWEELDDLMRFAFADFFQIIERTYQLKGTKIVYGDLPLDKDNFNPSRYLIPYFIKINERNLHMIDTIQKYNPDIVIVGRAHAEVIKARYSESYYIAFAQHEGNIFKRLLRQSPPLADKVTYLRN